MTAAWSDPEKVVTADGVLVDQCLSFGQRKAVSAQGVGVDDPAP